MRAAGGQADEISIGPPATESEIAATERKIGRRLPAAFRRVFREFSGSVFVHWSLPAPGGIAEGIRRSLEEAILGRPKDPLREVPIGDVGLSLGVAELAERARRRRCEIMRRRQETEDERLAPWARSTAWWELDKIAVAFDPDDSGADAPRRAGPS